MPYKSWKEFKPAWLKALRSGKYGQGTGMLCRPGNKYDKFCCLGVAYDLLIRAGNKGCEWKQGDFPDHYVNSEYDSGTLSGAVPKWFDAWLSAPYPQNKCDREEQLIDMNDHGKSFETIADEIERMSK